MGQKSIQQQRRLMTLAYVCMFFALFTVVTGVLAYVLASKVANSDGTEVWIQTQALWVMRNTTLFFVITLFGGLWFSPLYFYTWDAYQWVTGVTIVGVIFCFIAWMLLLNAFCKGFFKYLKHKAVF
ncbi:hypothetical protein [Acinetobacter rathckeae]|uniref:hypothetical protein n=1 Tax=Acinetobacter rathckeae TaxID=2605272 RepID=UPI0018A30B55|nr:hypothetical protein [Acinetobacter rathckeae]MBF7688079.1 hypothetical protein [Acinetobacter rathckeae]MBF7695409.1 hypothetical protein [Acinetobacter rathckeae]